MSKLTFNKMSRRILLSKYTCVFALTWMSLFSLAQTTVTVGTATTTTNNAPINAANAFHYSQCIYKASDIIAAGGTGAGTISKIRYYLGSGTPNANSAGWTVYLGHTNKVNFNSTTDWISAAGLTTCFSGTVTFPAAGNWMEIILTTPFEWNGIDNIVVGVDENQAGSGSTSFWRYTNYGSDNRTIITVVTQQIRIRLHRQRHLPVALGLRTFNLNGLLLLHVVEPRLILLHRSTMAQFVRDR